VVFFPINTLTIASPIVLPNSSQFYSLYAAIAPVISLKIYTPLISISLPIWKANLEGESNS